LSLSPTISIYNINLKKGKILKKHVAREKYQKITNGNEWCHTTDTPQVHEWYSVFKCKTKPPLLHYSWDPSTRLTPEEALQHDWIKDGLVNRRSKDASHGKHSSKHGGQSAASDHSTDPYKTPAQPPQKGSGSLCLWDRSWYRCLNKILELTKSLWIIH